MAGSIFGLGLSQRVKLTGKPEAGWRLYIYEAGTNTRATAYKDTGLTVGQEHPWPIAADAYGTMPAFWLDDGSYRVKGTSSTGSTAFFDMPSVLALGSSSGSGGGGSTVDATTIFQTGDVMWLDVSGTRSGWVRDNGRSIGSATSGASERANADCEDLFAYLWTNFSDTICAVSTGRGASAAADWAANKTIGVPDKRGRTAFGVADMGNSTSTILDNVTFTTGSKTAAGSTFGAAQKVLLQANLPAATLTTTIAAAQGAHTHTVPTLATSGQFANTSGIGAIGSYSGSQSASVTGSSTLPAMTGTTPLGGSATAFDIIPPGVLGSFYRKL